MNSLSPRLFRPYIVLGCILIAFVFNVERWKPAVFFGAYQDDGIYFTTAKALAEGQGYILNSFPGNPPQTKYPIAYPWLLSWIWKSNPDFPQNVISAIRLTEFFGCWTLIVTFFFLRGLTGIGEDVALLLTALLGFQPFFVRISGLVLSDVPFMAVSLTCLFLVNKAMSSKNGAAWISLAGAMAGVSVGLRMVGVAVIVGIFWALLRVRSIRKAFVFAIPASLLALAILLPTLLHSASNLSASTVDEEGWNQVLLYYTNYSRFHWVLSIPSVWALIKLVKLNVLILATSPGSILAGPSIPWINKAMAALSALIWLGAARQFRHVEWRPISCVLVFYAGILIIWPDTIPDRFLVPFLPLFLAGLWCELGRMAKVLARNLRKGSAMGQRLTAAFLSAALVCSLLFIVWNYLIADPRRLREASGSEIYILREKQQVYDWIRKNTSPRDRIAAWDDVSLYLYTGRQAVRPVAIRRQAAYTGNKASLVDDLAHICDAPRHVGARYWMTAEDDFRLEADRGILLARLDDIKSALPVLFRSTGNYAELHDASCVSDILKPDCRPVISRLFPK